MSPLYSQVHGALPMVVVSGVESPSSPGVSMMASGAAHPGADCVEESASGGSGPGVSNAGAAATGVLLWNSRALGFSPGVLGVTCN